MNLIGSWAQCAYKIRGSLTLRSNVGRTFWSEDVGLHGVSDSVDRQVGDLPHAASK